MSDPLTPEAHPVALPAAAGAPWLAWLLPLVTLAATVALLLHARAPMVELEVLASEGYGLEQGAPIRLQGVTVGRVEGVAMEGPGVVRLRVEIDAEASWALGPGAALHVVRPRISPAGVEGLEAILGPRFLELRAGEPGAAMEPGTLRVLDTPPPRPYQAGGLRVTLRAESRQGLREGASVLFRGMGVGLVERVALSGDATAVLAEVRIEEAYAGLVQDTSRFWEVGGLEFGLSLTGGVEVGVESLDAALRGAVALATGPGGRPVGTGASFALEEEPDPDWLQWRTPLVSGPAADLLAVPRPLLARRRWIDDGLLRRSMQVEGWVVPVPGGLLGPRALLSPAEGARDGRTELEVRGARSLLEPLPGAAGVVTIEDPQGGAPAGAAAAPSRTPTGPEEVLVLLGERIVPVGRDAWSVDEGRLLLRVEAGADPALGALVVGREDARPLGILGPQEDGRYPLLALPSGGD